LLIPRRYVAIRKALAALSGYFWVPCPLCGYDFAGFEVGRKGLLNPDDPWHAKLTCRWCDDWEGHRHPKWAPHPWAARQEEALAKLDELRRIQHEELDRIAADSAKPA
jgi:hypothetical protein